MSFTRSQSRVWTRGLLESQSRVPRQNSILQCLMKLGLLESRSRVPRQYPASLGPLVKLGLLDPETLVETAPASLQSQCLLVKLGLLRLRTAPRHGSSDGCTTSTAVAATDAKSAVEARLSGIAKHSLAECSGGAGPSWSSTHGALLVKLGILESPSTE